MATQPKIGSTYKLVGGEQVRLVKIFPFNPRLPERFRCEYSNGGVVDVRATELLSVEGVAAP